MSRYWQYNFPVSDRFVLRVQAVEVRGLFGGKGTVTGICLSGSVRVGDKLSVNGSGNKQYTVTAVDVYGVSVNPGEGTVMRLDLSGIKKKEVEIGMDLASITTGRPLFTDVYQYNGTDEDYFAKLFATFFPDYQVYQNLSIQGQDGEVIPVNCMFYRDGRPCLAVFLRTSQEWRHKEVDYLKYLCQQQGMTGIVFIRNFQNKADYLCRRIEEVLG